MTVSLELDWAAYECALREDTSECRVREGAGNHDPAAPDIQHYNWTLRVAYESGANKTHPHPCKCGRRGSYAAISGHSLRRQPQNRINNVNCQFSPGNSNSFVYSILIYERLLLSFYSFAIELMFQFGFILLMWKSNLVIFRTNSIFWLCYCSDLIILHFDLKNLFWNENYLWYFENRQRNREQRNHSLLSLGCFPLFLYCERVY